MAADDENWRSRRRTTADEGHIGDNDKGRTTQAAAVAADHQAPWTAYCTELSGVSIPTSWTLSVAHELPDGPVACHDGSSDPEI